MSLKDFLKRTPDIVYGYSDKSDGNISFKYGGVEEVVSNRHAFLKKKNLLLEDCVVMHPEHGDNIAVVGVRNKGKGALTENEGVVVDALITKERGVVLFLPTADCLPVAYIDPNKKVIGLVHLGWRSTEKNLASKVVKRMNKEFNVDPKDLIVLIGPGIRKDSYRWTDFKQKDAPAWKPFLESMPSGETKIDLVGYNKDQLVKIGVLKSNIYSDDANDTVKSPRFYSHYRSVRTNEPEGRFATIVS